MHSLLAQCERKRYLIVNVNVFSIAIRVKSSLTHIIHMHT